MTTTSTTTTPTTTTTTPTTTTTTTTTPPTTTPAVTPTTTPAATPVALSQPGATGNNSVIQTNVFLNSSGVSQTAGQISTTNGNVSFNVAAGTKMLTANGLPLNTVTVTPVPPSAPPAGSGIIVALMSVGTEVNTTGVSTGVVVQNVIQGNAFEFGPSGATFNPPLTMTLTYDPATIPAGVSETSLFLAYYDTTTGQWIALPGSVDDPVTHTVTAPTSHFTKFSVMAPRLTPTSTTTPTTLSVPTLSGLVPTQSSTTNWALIIGIIAAVVVIGLVIFFL